MKEKKKFKIKKIFKNSIFTFILGLFLASVIGVSAASVLYSKDVTYDNSSSGLSATNLQDALDELYEQAKTGGANVSCDDDGNCTVTCKQGNPTITDSGYSCTTYTSVECPSGQQLILKSNTTYKCGIPPVEMGGKKVDVVTSGSGLYADSVESGRYIYRGPSPDNYITFNGENAGWRIISVESDGTIKIMKISSLGDMEWDTANSRSATYCTQPQNGCNSWGSSSTMLNSSGANVTSMPREYGGTAYALPTVEATLNTYLNGTYYSSLTSTAKSQIASHNFNVGVLKLASGQTLATDVSQESAYKWKGKIALANATDYVRASTDSNCTSLNTYRNSTCYNNSASYNWMFNSAYWWTLSPSSYSYSTDVWGVLSGGLLNDGYARSTLGVRPVLYLSSDITLSGSGTEFDPYVIN